MRHSPKRLRECLSVFAGSLQWFFGFTAFLMPLAPTLLQTQQYTIDDNQIIVDTKQHWEAWEVKAGISSITQDGSISPRFLRKHLVALRRGTWPEGDWLLS